MALSKEQIAEVDEYLGAIQQAGTRQAVTVSPPKRVLAGVPFRVEIDARSLGLSVPRSRLWWRAGFGVDPEDVRITLIGPVNADARTGMALDQGGVIDDPLRGQFSIELLTHSVGDVGLGEVAIGLQRDDASAANWTPLGTVRVMENLRPRFYEQPFRGALSRLEHEYERGLATGVASIGVVGMGGSGKSRLSEEFALRQR